MASRMSRRSFTIRKSYHEWLDRTLDEFQHHGDSYAFFAFAGMRGRGERKWASVMLQKIVVVLALACPLAALAAEGGTGHYIPGGTATLIDLAPTKPGWVVEPMTPKICPSAR